MGTFDNVAFFIEKVWDAQNIGGKHNRGETMKRMTMFNKLKKDAFWAPFLFV